MADRERFLKEIGKRGAKLQDFELRDYTAEANTDSVPLTIGNFVMQYISDKTDLLTKIKTVKDKTKWREVIEVKAPEAAGFYKEGKKINNFDGTFKEVNLKSYKLAIGSAITNEALADTNFNFMSYIQQEITDKISSYIEEVIVRGTKAEGYDTSKAGAKGLLDYSVNDGTFETVRGENEKDFNLDIKTLIIAYYKLPQEFRNQCVLLAHPSFINTMQIMEDKLGHLLFRWDSSKQEFFGVPVIENKYLDDVTKSGGVPAMFVVLDKAIIANLRNDINIGVKHQVISQAANYTDLTHVFASIRFDSQLLYQNAISVIKNHTVVDTGEIQTADEPVAMAMSAKEVAVVAIEETVEEKPKRKRKAKTE